MRADATDKDSAYINVVQINIPEVTLTLVFDHIRIIMQFTKKLTKLRRDLQREAKDRLGKPVVKGSRCLLLKNPDKRYDKRDVRQHLEEALTLNEALATAYYMKNIVQYLV